MLLRSLWTGLRTDITAWVKGCTHCLSYNVCRNRKQELHFSWTVTISFYIVHVQLWSPGTAISNNSSGRHLLNAMCDLTQFVVSNITTEAHVEHLENLFMDNVTLSLSMVTILAVDVNSRFNSFFKYMCAALGIIYWYLACGNHKGVVVENITALSTKRWQSQANTEA